MSTLHQTQNDLAKNSTPPRISTVCQEEVAKIIDPWANHGYTSESPTLHTS